MNSGLVGEFVPFFVHRVDEIFKKNIGSEGCLPIELVLVARTGIEE